MRKRLMLSGLVLAAALIAIVSFRSREVPTLLALRLGLQSTDSSERGPWVSRVHYKGGTAYLVRTGIPDDLNRLYTAEGWMICSPSGGIGGDGDGSCPDALDPKDVGVGVWPPERKRDGGRRSE